MKWQLRVLMGAIGCVVLLATAGCGGTTTATTHIIVSVTVPVNARPSQPFKAFSVSAGYGHTCALDQDGHAYCWGDNTDGDLGDGTVTDRSTPVQVVQLL